MSSPLLRAFFVGRALSEALYEQAEHALTDLLSDLGKFDAEQRDRLRHFTQQVMDKAAQAEAEALRHRPASEAASVTASFAAPSADLQAMIDDLRAEIAELRNELTRYRSGG
jgi:uncharacterized protein YceH (UPF0502 family)